MERLKGSAVLGREKSERLRGKGNLPTDSFTLQDMKTRKTLKEKKIVSTKRLLTRPHSNAKQI